MTADLAYTYALAGGKEEALKIAAQSKRGVTRAVREAVHRRGSMSDAEEIWRGKTDDEVLIAASCLDDYTEEGRRIILVEADRRGLDVAHLVAASATLRKQPSTGHGRCAYCSSRILFGGKSQNDLRFCNEECRQRGVLIAVSHNIPDNVVSESVAKVFWGTCPQCGGPGPIDVHTSYRVWSALVVTSWSNRPRVTCKSCGRTNQLRDAAVCLFLGWWGFPWGIVMTPIQLVRNLTGLLSEPASQPSTQLERLIRLDLATKLSASSPNHAMDPAPN
jgi:hypothetical protein